MSELLKVDGKTAAHTLAGWQQLAVVVVAVMLAWGFFLGGAHGLMLAFGR